MRPRNLGFRVSATVGLALLIGLGLFFYFSMSHHEEALLKLKKEEATLLSDSIKASLSHAMLQGQAGRDSIHRAIERVSARPEIERIRIYNAVGDVQYSSVPAEMGMKVNKEAENCKHCHFSDEPLDPATFTDLSRFFYTPSDSGESQVRVLGVINPIRNDHEQNCQACHGEQSVLGVLDVVVSLRNLDADIDEHRGSLLLFGLLGVVAMIGVVALVVHYLVHRPVAALVTGTERVGGLELDYRLPTDRQDELGNLAAAFNSMTARLQQAQAEVREFAESLEEKVREKSAELESAQEQMLRSEKMVAIGQMAAGVAHEINNPLTGVITFASLLKRKTPPDTAEYEDLETIIEEARRCSKIARGLLDFARGGNLDRRDVDVRSLLTRTLGLVENQALFHNIEVRRDYAEELPTLSVDPDRIQQVFLNLVVNAAEAMQGKGTLVVAAHPVHGAGGTVMGVRVTVTDDGPGIDPEVRARVFDPFFTTREAGQGTGLGLSVSYRIIEDHKGRIHVDSPEEGGTRFTVMLPVPRAGGGA